MSYQLFTDATADLSEELLQGVAPVETIPMDVTVEGKSYQYGPGGTLSAPEFYAMQRSGKFASTSQINPSVYCMFFEPYLEKKIDVLYLCFSSGMSGTIQNARLAIEELRKKYPERTIHCVDTLCASIGEGLLVREAAKRQAEGMSIEALIHWVEESRLRVCHWVIVDTFEHLKHGGRVSSATAVVGTMLQIKPLIHVDEAGTLQVVGKLRGKQRAMQEQLSYMQQRWQPAFGTTVIIGHGDCPSDAQKLSDMVGHAFPNAERYITDIGPVIGAHTGPGVLVLSCFGTNR